MSTINAILSRSLYAGIAEWGRVQKSGDVYRELRLKRKDPTVRTSVPHLAIIDDETWRLACERRADFAKRAIRFGGQLLGRPAKGGERRLLAGFLVCATCGGGVVAERGRLVCNRFRSHGEHVCANKARIAVADADEAVLHELEEHVLVPQRIEEFLLSVERDANEDEERRGRLEKQQAEVEAQTRRLVDARAGGTSAPGPVVERIAALERERAAIDRELRAAAPLPRLDQQVLSSRLEGWRKALRGSVTQARAVLGRVLDGKAVMTPMPGGFALIEARTKFSRLFTGVVVRTTAAGEMPDYVKPGDTRGHEAEADIEASYEALLAAAEEGRNVRLRRVRPWWDSNPRSPP